MFILPELTFEFYKASSPILVLILGSLISLMQSVSPWGRSRNVFSVLITSFVLSLFLMVQKQMTGVFLGGSFLFDDLTYFAQFFVLVLSLFVVFLFHGSYLKEKFFRAEIAAIFQMIVSGMLISVSSYDFVTIIVGLELASLGLYALIGYVEPTQKSQEAAMKYLIMGSVATAFVLFGMALLYAGYGVLQLDELQKLAASVKPPIWSTAGALFIVCGLAFKLALVPFHSWAPDAYEGAPTGLTAFMSTAVKVVILMLFFRMSHFAYQVFHVQWFNVIYAVCILSMLVGNTLALVQTSLKRMLAYSSVAHSGYMAIALSSLAFEKSQLLFTYQSVAFYLLSYVLASVVMFSVLSWLENEKLSNLQLDDMKGLAKTHPWASMALTCALLSFAGFPPTIGFFAKLLIFKSAISASLLILVLAGIIASVVGLFYYLRVVVYMYFHEPKESAFMPTHHAHLTVVISSLAIFFILTMGTIFPGKLLHRLEPVFGTFVLK